MFKIHHKSVKTFQAMDTDAQNTLWKILIKVTKEDRREKSLAQ